MARYPYLLNRNGHYYFRIAVPLFHMDTLGRKELICSLKTKDFAEARIRSAAILNVAQEVFQLAQAGRPDIALQYWYDSLRELAFKRNQFEKYPALLGKLSSPVLIPVTDSPHKGDACAIKGPSLAEAIETYTKEKIRLNAWSQRSIKSKRTDLSLLKEILGEDYNIASMTDKEARDIKGIVLDMPVNRRKNLKTRHLTIHQAIKITGVEKISVKTAQLTIGTFFSFFEWAKSHKMAEVNYFEGLTIATPKGARKPKRLPFNDVSMRKILDALEAKKVKGTIKDYQYWGTLLGIYTGARLNELAQMEAKDVRQIEGIWCLDLNDDDERKHLKNESSKRLVPLHPALIDKGLLSYVDTIRQSKNERVLYELVFDENNGYGRNLGRWFNDFLLPELGLKTKLHVYHSLRHTVVTKLMRAGIEQPLVRALIGHTQEGVLQKHYFTEGYTLKQLAEALGKLQY